MHVVVLGAGVIGVTSAYYLARDGHQVTVIDRQPAVALETSFANGGQISASHADPWPSPENLRRVLGWIGRRGAPIRLRPRLDPALLRWCRLFLGNCTTERARINTERMLRVALYSRDELAALHREHAFAYERTRRGILHVFRNPVTHAVARRQAALVRDLGCERREVSVEECVAIEPALAPVAGTLAGGFYCPEDESGDARAFTEELAEACRSLGATFRLGEAVARLRATGNRLAAVETDRGTLEPDAVVMALGSYGASLLRPLGLRLPVYPAKGYSVTLDAVPAGAAPSVSLIDDERKLVYSRLGDRLRVAGMAEFVGHDTTIDRFRAGLVRSEALALFPGLTSDGDPAFWAGLRPQTPDSVPVIGPTTRYENLWLNTGHGTLGWTMSCGSGRIIADLIGGRDPGVLLDGLTSARFGC